jgi:hypothetical protein
MSDEQDKAEQPATLTLQRVSDDAGHAVYQAAPEDVNEDEDADSLESLLIPEDKRYKWKRQQGESVEEWRMFIYYCRMPYETVPEGKSTSSRFRPRALQRVRRMFRLSPTALYELARHNAWQDRAKSYDEYMIMREQRALERQMAADTKKWTERRNIQREKEWAASEKLIAFAQKVLDHVMTWPLVRETIETSEELGEDGLILKTIINRVPADLSMNDIARALELGSKLARMSANMDTDKKRLRIDLSALGDEELEEIINNG